MITTERTPPKLLPARPASRVRSAGRVRSGWEGHNVAPGNLKLGDRASAAPTSPSASSTAATASSGGREINGSPSNDLEQVADNYAKSLRQLALIRFGI